MPGQVSNPAEPERKRGETGSAIVCGAKLVFQRRPNTVGDMTVAENNSVFATTHWSVIVAAGKGADSPHAREALETLCRAYWYPLYAYARQLGQSHAEAQDLTQSFFLQLLDKSWLAQVDRTKGKFRSFLLVAMNHFLANEWRRLRAEKRGGQAVFISLDDESVEERWQLEPVTWAAPETAFEQRWAAALLERVLFRLRAEQVAAGKSKLFDELKVFIVGRKGEVAYTDLAAKLGSTEGALKMSVQRLRHRYGEILREELASTVSSEVEIEAELRYLLAVLQG
jgi:DNA-directed RNA polymerase specialized sigma24 family protein